MQLDLVARVRSFNRAVTVRTGALADSYLGRGRPLGPARVLFETGSAGIDLGELRRRLGLDSGYATRLLRSLSRQGLLMVEVDPADRRRRKVRLTPAGLAEWNAYDRMSDALALSILDPLGESQRRRLVAAMAEVETLLSAASITIEAEPHDSADARACLDAYFAELAARFETGFDPNAGGGKPPVSECFLIARSDGRAIGCGALMRLDGETGEIKRMWIAEEARGLGLSRRLLEALEQRAKDAGMRRIRLDTNRTLAEAQSLYRSAGYREITRYNDNPYAHLWYEKRIG